MQVLTQVFYLFYKVFFVSIGYKNFIKNINYLQINFVIKNKYLIFASLN